MLRQLMTILLTVFSYNLVLVGAEIKDYKAIPKKQIVSSEILSEFQEVLNKAITDGEKNGFSAYDILLYLLSQANVAEANKLHAEYLRLMNLNLKLMYQELTSDVKPTLRLQSQGNELEQIKQEIREIKRDLALQNSQRAFQSSLDFLLKRK